MWSREYSIQRNDGLLSRAARIRQERQAMLATQGADTLRVTGNASQAVPEPLLSSRSRQWNGIVVELRRARDVDVVLQYRDHAIAVILGGGAKLCQCRNGRTASSTLRSGDVIITPAGGPKRWQHVEDAAGIVLR